MRVNLNDNVNDHFEFTLGGVDFNLKYPSLEELEPVSQLNSERAEAEAKKDTAKVKEIEEKLTEAFYGLITAVDGKSDIAEVLKKQPFPVVKKFNEMISEQLSTN